MKPKRNRTAFCKYILAAGLLCAGFCGRAERTVASLDGKWGFRLDPQDVGRKEQWFKANGLFTNTIQVPGAWQAQGYGSESDKLWHHYEGKAWYKRQVQLPKLAASERLFLCFGGVHRSAEIWVNGDCLGNHLGYLSTFEFELTSIAATNSTATIAVCVDGKQHWEVDCLTGCVDIIDAMFTPWGGIWGHVWLERRPAVWLEDVFVQPRFSPPGCVVTAHVAGDKSLASGARLEVRSKHGQKLAFVERAISASGELRLETHIPDAKLWSPDSPHLYTARLNLLSDRATHPPILQDRVEIPFGVREMKIEGCNFYLNGKKLFLRGYGDDAIYPKTMAPPADKAFYRQRLAVAKQYGFNFVRHHSHFLPAEYYEAADEVGMLISPEFPIAYQEYYQKAKGPALELYKSEWAATIKRQRNHPSIFDWSMANEMYNSFPLAPELYRTAKALDPTRPVIDSDGLPGHFLPQGVDRDTLDFFMVQFDEWALPLDRPEKHRSSSVPKKPVVSHETANYVTVPRLDLIEQFQDNFKPFWLTPFRAKLEKLGLLAEAEEWSRNSERLYGLAHKLNLEDLRKNPRISGYTWWLLQDYWTGANGLVDTYFRPKSIRPEFVRQFNAPVVLLQDGLPLTASALQPVKLRLLVSNFSPEPIHNGAIQWTVRLGKRVLAKGRQGCAELPQGELSETAAVEVKLPAVSQPEKLSLEAQLNAGSLHSHNGWYAWVYPAPAPDAQPSTLFASPELLPMLRPLGAKPLPDGESLPSRAVFVVRQPTFRVLKAVESGASLVCLSPQGIFPSVPNRFKSAWWLGSETDCNAGTVVYPHPVTRPIAPDGWCDLGWYRLVQGAQAYVLDEVPFSSQPVLVRALDVHTVCRNKALLFEARMGRGSLLVSGLRLEPQAGAPERDWLLAQLIQYAATFPQPKAALPVSFLSEKIKDLPEPTGPFLSGFTRVRTQAGERANYPSYRESEAPLFVCRQLEAGRSLEWETATVPANWNSSQVTFIFAGGLGWKSEPKSAGFVLLVNGREVVSFDVAFEAKVWAEREGKAKLWFVPQKNLPEDALGLFYLSLPTNQLKPGEPCRLTVRSQAKGSRRWFGLNAYSDLTAK